MDELAGAERAVVEAGYDWLDRHETALVDLLEELVARPSVTGAEGVHDDPASTVGHLWSSLDDHLADERVTYQRLPTNAEPAYATEPRENIYTVSRAPATAASSA